MDERFCNGFEEVFRLASLARETLCPIFFAFAFRGLLFAYDSSNIYNPPPFFFSASRSTLFAFVIEMAITIVEQSGGQYHVLVIVRTLIIEKT